MIFWTRNPENLIKDKALLEPYQKVIHFTLTGWEEVEKAAPTLEEGLELMAKAADAFGPENMTWRFSPIPTVPDAFDRFDRIAQRAISLGIPQCYVAFLQTNDLLTEGRSLEERRQLLVTMGLTKGIEVLLCNEDSTLAKRDDLSIFISKGICEDGSRFRENPQTEKCGCAFAIDPFTINESCIYGCQFCYAADKKLTPRKRNTTKKSLPLINM